MANVDIKLGYKDSAWFTANPTLILKQGQIVALEQTGTYKLGDGVTQLSALTFLGGGGTVDVNTIGAAINGATSATPNDTDLVMSVDTSVAKKNTWTQIKAFLKTYFDTLFVKKGTLTTNYLQKADGLGGVTDSSISDDGTTVIINSGTYVNSGTGAELSAQGTEVYMSADAQSNTNIGTNLLGNEFTHNIKNTFNSPSNNFPQLTASQIVATDASKNLQTLSTATYPSLTELSYAKGVTSAIQTQLNDKLTASNNLSDLTNVNTARNNLKEWDLYITSGDQSTTSNVSSNITDLVSPTLTANKRYDFEGHIYASSNYTGGVKFQITIPTGATITACFDGPIGSNSTSQSGIVLASATLTGFSFIQFNGSSMIKVKGQVLLGGTTGTIQFGFASATNTRTSTVNQLGTHITLRQLD